MAVVVCLRIAGKRTLARMDEYDLAVTVAVGSVIESTMLSPDLSVLQGIAAIIGWWYYKFRGRSPRRGGRSGSGSWKANRRFSLATGACCRSR